MLGREHRDRRLLQPYLHVPGGGRLRPAQAEEDGPLRRHDDPRRAAFEIGNRVAAEGPRDAHAVRSVLLDLRGRGLGERGQQRLLAVLLERDLEVARVCRAGSREGHLDGGRLADVFGGLHDLDGRAREATGIHEQPPGNEGNGKEEADQIPHAP